MRRMLPARASNHPGVAEPLNGWYRAGRGREMQFYATDEEIADWLVKTLPLQYAPYVILRQQWAFSGLIAIRVTDEFGGRIEPASMTMVDRIRYETTGEERSQPEYLRIFERLRRSMRKRLVVNTEDWPSTKRSAVERAQLPTEPP